MENRGVNRMICHECPLGQEERRVGNGMSESPYIFLVRCPFDNEYYKNWDDECDHDVERLTVMNEFFTDGSER